MTRCNCASEEPPEDFVPGNEDSSVLACLGVTASTSTECDESEQGLKLREKAFWSTRVFGYTVVEEPPEKVKCDAEEKFALYLWLLGLFLLSQIAYLINGMMPYEASEDYSPAVRRMRGDVKESLLELVSKSDPVP